MNALKLKTLALVTLLLLAPLHAFAQSAEEAFKEGKMAYRQEQYAEAIKHYSKAIQLDPKYSKAYYNRGNVKCVLGDQIGAIQDLNKAIQLDPQDAHAYMIRGLVKAVSRDHTGAIQDYNKAIQLDPQDAHVYTNRGIAKAKSGDKRGAFADLEKAKQLFVEQGDMEGYKDAIKTKNVVSDLFVKQGK